jgi:glutathionylspermidine synthase
MIELKSLAISPQKILAETGWDWMLGTDTQAYVGNAVVKVADKEANAFFDAANELYEMYTAAAQHVIDQNLYKQLGIAPILIPLIESSWEADKNWHVYGRFDLAGGTSGLPIKLLEFNADTATCIPETALVQWASLKANGLANAEQFNTLFEQLVVQFKTIKSQNPGLHPSMLFSTMDDTPEDEANIEVLMEAAREAGFEVHFDYVQNIHFSAQEGILIQNPGEASYAYYPFWFKLIPWEFIASDEPQLVSTLLEIQNNGLGVALNPTYTLLFQSKGILKILWDLYPYHPLLLETDYHPLLAQSCVQKVLFGREGANVKILSAYGSTTEQTMGDYGTQASVYQAFTTLDTDNAGQYFQAGVFFAGEACGLGFRAGGKILDNLAHFYGHIIE